MYQFVKNKCMEHQYFKITRNGHQVSMFNPDPFEYILHIENKGVVKYHFMKDTYEIAHPEPILGLSVTINNTPHVLNPTQFYIAGTTLFDETITLWLCRHYFKIYPTTESQITIIDQFVDVTTQQTITI